MQNCLDFVCGTPVTHLAFEPLVLLMVISAMMLLDSACSWVAYLPKQGFPFRGDSLLGEAASHGRFQHLTGERQFEPVKACSPITTGLNLWEMQETEAPVTSAGFPDLRISLKGAGTLELGSRRYDSEPSRCLRKGAAAFQRLPPPVGIWAANQQRALDSRVRKSCLGK